MKKPVQDEQQEKETLVDWLKGIGLVGIPLWIVLFFLCCVGISECRDRHSKNRPTPPPYRTEDIYQHRPIENTRTVTKRSFAHGDEDDHDAAERIIRPALLQHSGFMGADGHMAVLEFQDCSQCRGSLRPA